MPKPTGRPPKPTEVKRRTGNPGGRKLPDTGVVELLPAIDQTPEPARPLSNTGRQLWERAWRSGRAWLADTDTELLLLTCEQLDERQILRMNVLQKNDWRDRAGLRALDKEIAANLAMLGFSPVDRTRLGVAEVKAQSALEEVRRRRAQRNETG
jgi:hypothetical protein